MNAADVVAYIWEDTLTCTRCAGPELTGGSKLGPTPDDVGVIFADADNWEHEYCGDCGHSLACTEGLSCDCDCEKCFPTHHDSSRWARKSLPEDVRKAVTDVVRSGGVFEARVRMHRRLFAKRERREVRSVTIGVRSLSRGERLELESVGFREMDSWRYEWTAR